MDVAVHRQRRQSPKNIGVGGWCLLSHRHHMCVRMYLRLWGMFLLISHIRDSTYFILMWLISPSPEDYGRCGAKCNHDFQRRQHSRTLRTQIFHPGSLVVGPHNHTIASVVWMEKNCAHVFYGNCCCLVCVCGRGYRIYVYIERERRREKE